MELERPLRESRTGLRKSNAESTFAQSELAGGNHTGKHRQTQANTRQANMQYATQTGTKNGLEKFAAARQLGLTRDSAVTFAPDVAERS